MSEELLNDVLSRIGWKPEQASFRVLQGGLAHRSYVATAREEQCVIKLLTQAMDDFGLMISITDLLHNSVAAAETGVAPKVMGAFADVPALVLEYVDGRTFDTQDLSAAQSIPRLGRAVRRLHDTAPAFSNRIDIWEFLERYLGLVERHQLPTPPDLLAMLPTVHRIQAALEVNPLPTVASHNDLLAKNIMDDGQIRLIDYDFSGMNDPCFDLGDLAMEGDYSPDQTEVLCESYFGQQNPTQTARVRLFSVAAQYTWSLLFVGIDKLLAEGPADGFDYWAEAVKRWEWTRTKLEAPELGSLIQAAGAGARIAR